MTTIKNAITILILLAITSITYADNTIADAVAASLTSQVVSTGTAVYLKNNGIEPQFVSGPYGTYTVPAPSNSAAPAPQSAPTPSPYETQNQQQNKIEFVNGNVVQSFSDLPPADTSGTNVIPSTFNN